MTASHPRRMAVFASLMSASVGMLSACGSSAQSASSISVQCNAGAVCATSAVTQGETSLTVASDPSRSNQTLSAQLVPDQQLHCPSFMSSGGALAIFSSTATDAAKIVTYVVTGTAGQAVAAAHLEHPGYLGCFGSPQPFNGYVSARHARAVFVQADGLYEAQLLACGRTDAKPCFNYSASGGSVTLTVQAPAGDPKLVG